MDFAAPAGPNPPLDHQSVEMYQDEESVRFLKDEVSSQKLASAIPLKDVDHSMYDAIFYVGGFAPVLDLPEDPVNIALANQFWRSGRIVSAVCHGPAYVHTCTMRRKLLILSPYSALVNVTDVEGHSIFAARVATSFSNEEDAAVGFTAVSFSHSNDHMYAHLLMVNTLGRTLSHRESHKRTRREV